MFGLVLGTWRAFAGAMTVGDELIAKMMGQGTDGRLGDGAQQFKSGIRQFFFGASTKTKPAKPKKINPKPVAKSATHTQSKIQKPSRPTEKPATKVAKPAPKPVAKQVVARTQDGEPSRKPIAGEPKPRKKWLELAERYKKARIHGGLAELKKIQLLMGKTDPIYYHWVLYRSRARKSKKKS